MLEKIKSILQPSEKEIFLKKLERFRKDHIPSNYNQVKMLDELINPNIDHFISISNRTDGKSINYTHALIHIAIEYDLGLTFLSRNMMLRNSYKELINDVIGISTIYEREDFNFIRNQYYTSLNYKEKTIAIISDLNDASELKYFSNYIKKFPIIIYDEFLALQSEYLSDEFTRLKTIYESIDRIETVPLITKPKIFYFGNAVNFDSPILHGLKIFNILEKHPINTAKIYEYDFNVMLEMNRNENANKRRNVRAFNSGNDSMTTAQFETNSHNIAIENDLNEIMKNPRKFYVKLEDSFLKIYYNYDTMKIVLSIVSFIEDDYSYNIKLKDNKETSIYLTEKYFSENEIKKHDRDVYLYENNFSKNYITTDSHGLNTLKILKLIREKSSKENLYSESLSKEQQFKDNYLQETKRNIFKNLFG